MDITDASVGGTALMHAAQFGHYEVAKELLHARASVDLTGRSDWAPLHLAAMEGHSKVVQMLLVAGATKALPTADGKTPLSIAREQGHTALVSTLSDQMQLMSTPSSRLLACLMLSVSVAVVLACVGGLLSGKPRTHASYGGRLQRMHRPSWSAKMLLALRITILLVTRVTARFTVWVVVLPLTASARLCATVARNAGTAPAWIMSTVFGFLYVRFSDLWASLTTAGNKLIVHLARFVCPASSADITNLCGVCLASPKDMAFLCGHTICRNCGAHLSECHICRASITHRIRLYDS